MLTQIDDTVILASDVVPVTASTTLQRHLDEIQTWQHKWKIKINETKSAQVTFTLIKERSTPSKQHTNTTIHNYEILLLGNISRQRTDLESTHIKKMQTNIDLKTVLVDR